MRHTIVLAGTGHRPPRLGTRAELVYSTPVMNALIDLVTYTLDKLRPARVISGGALGFDQALAIAAIRKRIPVVLAVPFPGQELRWPEPSQELYRRILARSKVQVLAPHYTPQALQRRNEWMIDHATELLALFDGRPTGGTAQAVAYAHQTHVPIIHLWNTWVDLRAARGLS